MGGRHGSGEQYSLGRRCLAKRQQWVSTAPLQAQTLWGCMRGPALGSDSMQAGGASRHEASAWAESSPREAGGSAGAEGGRTHGEGWEGEPPVSPVSSVGPCACSPVANLWAPRHSNPLASVQDHLVKVWFRPFVFQAGKGCARNCTKGAVRWWRVSVRAQVALQGLPVHNGLLSFALEQTRITQWWELCSP